MGFNNSIFLADVTAFLTAAVYWDVRLTAPRQQEETDEGSGGWVERAQDERTL